MKKLLMTGILAITALAMSQQQAHAWVNARFGIGLNYQWQSGGNQFLWGAWTGGQPPGPEFGGGYFGPEIMPHGHGYNGQATYPMANYSAPTMYYTQPTYQSVNFPGYYSMPSYYYPVSG